jgi:ferredoxin-NADP reductase
MDFVAKILSVTEVTHDVRCIRIEKPAGYTFIPGHATDVAINKPGLEREKRPFTFTSLDSDPYIEFTVKCYVENNGVTKQVKDLRANDELIIGEPWGTIEYKGPGYFIAGGAGITPFIAILRQLNKHNSLEGNKLFFSNQTVYDIIYEHELAAMPGLDAVFVLTEAGTDKYPHDYIDETFLETNIDNFSRHFYVCGPDKMVESISKILVDFGAQPDKVIFEK